MCNQNIFYFVKSVFAFKGCHLPSTEKWCNLVFSILYLVLYSQFKKYIQYFNFLNVSILYLLSSNIILSKYLHYCFHLICLSILIQFNLSEYFLEYCSLTSWTFYKFYLKSNKKINIEHFYRPIAIHCPLLQKNNLGTICLGIFICFLVRFQSNYIFLLIVISNLKYNVFHITYPTFIKRFCYVHFATWFYFYTHLS